MAILHFVKDGKNGRGEHITESIDVDAGLAIERLKKYAFLYSKEPPTIKAHIRASDMAKYKNVVLEIERNEGFNGFSNTGYYLIRGLAPIECSRLLYIK